MKIKRKVAALLPSALTSLLFPDDPEPAFAHYHLGRTFALCVTFAVSPHLCFDVKTYLFLVSLCVAALSVLGLEVKLKCCPPTEPDMVTQIDADVTQEKMLAITNAQKAKLANATGGSRLSGSFAGSLSGSCTNMNIQA